MPTAIQTVLARLVDYAGLFPPAALPMDAAVREYDEHLRSPERWMLGRFIVPAARLAEFEDAATPYFARASQPWLLSLLPGADLPASIEQAVAFNNRASGPPGVSADVSASGRQDVRIDTVEFKLPATLPAIPPEFTAYVELPLDDSMDRNIVLLAHHGARAKIRTGGVTEDAFPSPEQVARFILACTDHGVPFKATAGLHHPLRGAYRLTYEPGSPHGTMFGFVNIFLAATFAKVGMNESDLVDLLVESSPAAFTWRDDGVSWRSHTLSNGDLALMRERVGMGFGSCSFREPTEDLHRIGWL